MRTRFLLSAAVAAAVLGSGTTAFGGTPPLPVVIPCNGGSGATLQDGLSGAPANGTVQLAANCTSPLANAFSPGVGLPTIVKKKLTITGGPNTVIDGGNLATIFLIGKGGNLTL